MGIPRYRGEPASSVEGCACGCVLAVLLWATAVALLYLLYHR